MGATFEAFSISQCIDILNSLRPDEGRVYRDVFDRLALPCFFLDIDGFILDLNKKGCSETGYSRSEIIGTSLSRVLTSNSDNDFACAIGALSVGKVVLPVEMSLLKKDGSVQEGSCNLALGYSSFYEREVVHVSCYFSEKRGILREITDPEIRVWMKICNRLDEIITIHDNDLRIVAANHAAQNYFAGEYGTIYGRYCYEVFSGENKPCQTCPLSISSSPEHFQAKYIFNERLGRAFQVDSHLVTTEVSLVTYQLHTVRITKDQSPKIISSSTPAAQISELCKPSYQMRKQRGDSILVSPEEVAKEDSDLPVKLADNGETILLIDDDFFLMEMTSRLLRTLGYKVIPTISFLGAMEIAQDYPEGIDLLLTGVQVAGENALPVAQGIIELHPTCKVLYMVGYSVPNHFMEAPGAENLDFIQKPYSTSTLSKKVYAALHSS